MINNKGRKCMYLSYVCVCSCVLFFGEIWWFDILFYKKILEVRKVVF